ncbi:hypothetical protein [Mariniblastus fucicola]|uniref:Uncharacterized protein n=1 Tax=Mariniblastus fucicola TaxID=980251 RepID=A0A5B9P6U0_9BACT|nr:hypothetical protein [Mariniblastus fucicola]QEG20895.1 hypothetical protein MFFC18_07460 [Mariniblastus fucicola]
MVRYLPILLGACVAIVSGLIGAVGVRALAHYEKVSAPAVEMTFDEFARKRLADTSHYKLTNIRHGASVYPEPTRKDGEWEKVYVCLFSNETTRLGKNYISIIAEIDGVSGTEELAKLLQAGELEIYYWPNKQGLPQGVYNRMAQKYRGMDFDRCLHCESGGPPPSPDFGNSCIYVGIGGVTLSIVCVIAFYLIKLIGSMIFRERDPWYDDEEDHQISNKAGLPSA